MEVDGASSSNCGNNPLLDLSKYWHLNSELLPDMLEVFADCKIGLFTMNGAGITGTSSCCILG